MQKYLPAQPGDMLDVQSGNVVGRHDGLMYYTLGQRKGLGIGGRGDGRPWFVLEKDMENNRLIVSQGEADALFTASLEASGLSWISGEAPARSFDCAAKVRYRQSDQRARAFVDGDLLRLEFAEKQRGVTPGQYAVLYDGDICLGGGVIDRAF